MMRKIRQAKVQIEAAMFWVIMALILVVFAVVAGVADLYKALGYLFHLKFFIPVYDLLLINIKAFGMTIQLSQLESKQSGADPENGSGTEIPGRKRDRAGRKEAALETCRKGE